MELVGWLMFVECGIEVTFRHDELNFIHAKFQS